MLRPIVRRLLLLIALVGLVGAALAFPTTDAAAQDNTLRPSCVACQKERKTYEDLKTTIADNKKKLIEVDTDNDLRRLDAQIEKDQRAQRDALVRLDKCEKECPATLFVSVKPVTVKTCPECQKVAKELGDLMTQQARAEAELEVVKGRKAKYSVVSAAEREVTRLGELVKKKNREFLACEEKHCRAPKKEASNPFFRKPVASRPTTGPK